MIRQRFTQHNQHQETSLCHPHTRGCRLRLWQPACPTPPEAAPSQDSLRGGFDKKPATSLRVPGASGRVTHAA